MASDSLEGILMNLQLLHPEAAEEEERRKEEKLCQDAIKSLLKIFHEQVVFVAEEAKTAAACFDQLVECLRYAGIPGWDARFTEQLTYRREVRDVIERVTGEGDHFSWRSYQLLEDTPRRLKVDEATLQSLQAVDERFSDPPPLLASQLTENISQNAWSRALKEADGPATFEARTKQLMEARKRDREATDELLLVKDLQTTLKALFGAKSIGLHFVDESQKQSMLDQELSLIDNYAKTAVGVATTAKMKPSLADLQSVVGMEALRRHMDQLRNDNNAYCAKLLYELARRDEAAKRRLNYALETKDAKMLKQATDDFKRVGLSAEDGSLEEGERALILLASDLAAKSSETEAEKNATQPDGGHDDAHGSWNRIRKILRPDAQVGEMVRQNLKVGQEKGETTAAVKATETALVDQLWGKEELGEGSGQAATVIHGGDADELIEHIDAEEWEALSEALNRTFGRRRRLTTAATTMTTTTTTAEERRLKETAEKLALMTCLIDGKSTAFQKVVLRTSTGGLKAFEEALAAGRNVGGEALHDSVYATKETLLNELKKLKG